MSMPNYNDMVHKRVHIHKSTSMLLSTMSELMGESYRDTFEAALLYGLAYMNEYNNMHMTQWLDEVKLPKIDDVDKFIKVS